MHSKEQDFIDSLSSEIITGSHSVQAAELIAGHADDDGDELPANSLASQQLQHRGGVHVVLRTRLRMDLLQLLRHVFLPQQPLES